MEPTHQKEDLLEELQLRTGCIYLSDLHQAQNASLIAKAVRDIPCDQYSLRAWNDAIHYILSKIDSPETPEQCKMLLLQELKA